MSSVKKYNTATMRAVGGMWRAATTIEKTETGINITTVQADKNTVAAIARLAVGNCKSFTIKPDKNDMLHISIEGVDSRSFIYLGARRRLTLWMLDGECVTAKHARAFLDALGDTSHLSSSELAKIEPIESIALSNK